MNDHRLNLQPSIMDQGRQSTKTREAPAPSRSAPTVESWNLILTGISAEDGQVWCPNAMAKVDVVLIQGSKPTTTPASHSALPEPPPSLAPVVSKLVEKTVDLEITSVSSSPNELQESKRLPRVASKCPVIAIHGGGLDPNVLSLKLNIRVTIPPSKEVKEGQQSKRKRFTPAKSASEDLELLDEVYVETSDRSETDPENEKEEPEIYTGSAVLLQRSSFPNAKLKQKDLSIQLKKSQGNSAQQVSSSRAGETGALLSLSILKSKDPLPDFVPPPKHLLPPPATNRKVKMERTASSVKTKVGNSSKWSDSFPCPPPFPLFPVNIGLSPDWLRERTERTVSEYTDVNKGEKQLMNMWNAFIQSHAVKGDCQLEWACQRFVELHGEELLTQNLRLNFTLHLTNLFDYGLLTSEQVRSIIVQLDSQKRVQEGFSVQDSVDLFDQLKVENDDDDED